MRTQPWPLGSSGTLDSIYKEEKEEELLDGYSHFSAYTQDNTIEVQVPLRLVWTMEFFMFTTFEISWFLSARGSVLQAQAKIKIFS